MLTHASSKTPPAWQDNRMAQGDSFTPPFEVGQLGRFTSELNRETDRGAALVAASRLDEILKIILASFLRKTKSSDDLLEGFNAPLGMFSARASACHALGLIQDNEFDEITKIRKVRNEFGHQWQGVNFDSERIRDLIDTLPWGGPEEYEAEAPRRSRFTTAAVMLQVVCSAIIRDDRATHAANCPRTLPIVHKCAV
jgi:DNA-binding MltR family transcriptional regulator